MKTITKLLLTGITALSANISLIHSAHADEGLYIGAGVYQADVDVSDINDDQTTAAFFLGYNFFDSNLLMLSAEAGFYDLGDFSSPNSTVDADAFTVAGVAMLPLGPVFEIYAKAGVAFIDVSGSTPFGSISENSEEGFYGAGASIDILDTIDIYAEYLQFDNAVESELIGVGVRLAF